jgi:hypothetical protein
MSLRRAIKSAAAGTILKLESVFCELEGIVAMVGKLVGLRLRLLGSGDPSASELSNYPMW